MTAKMKRALRIVGTTMAVIASLSMAACGKKEKAPLTVPKGAQAGDLVDLEPCTYKEDKVEYAADCGTLVVPENRSNLESRLIVKGFNNPVETNKE
jgi:predicted small lipoprotein YifL